MAQYLFVVTRNLESDVTARYVLRSALGLCRHDHEVTVFLADDAVGGFNARCAALIEPLISASARVVAGAPATECEQLIPGDCGIRTATDDELAHLLLTPGIQAQWC